MPETWQRRHLWIAASIGSVLLGLGIWLVVATLPGFLNAPETAPSTNSATVADARRIHATLFYVTDDGAELLGVSREVLYGATPTEQLRRIVEAQIQPPPNGARSAIPAGTTVRAVYLSQRNEAYVDLGGTIISGHIGGSLNEALTVYAIVNAVTVNLPDVTAVQILVEGKEVDSLMGHLDLRYPLGKSLDWVRKGQ